ncbi:UNKNOWN [Stylonychia lemnae]|uniref:Uncharacterized protein n=1 Tax=Stylonychia lemnae TaxID=5949 RepID=A0A078ANS4_STYLE|nr:UNKNOWN [Stylonychia lemnae]|eukprot:CDW82957.1 UNKNOWN [Stylonychia lemnae]
MVIMCIVWTTALFNLHLMDFVLPNIKGNIHINNMLQTTGQFLAYGISVPIINKIGIKLSFVLFLTLCCFTSLFYILVSKKSTIFIAVLVFLSKLGSSPIYTLTYISSNKLFPANIKATLFSICNIFARSITIGAPSVAVMKQPIPFVAFGVASFICLISTIFLNFNKLETNQNKLQRIAKMDLKE